MFTGWVVSEKLRCGRPAGGVSTWLKGREPSVGGWKKFREAVTGPEGTVREMAIVVRKAWEGMVEWVIGGVDGMVRWIALLMVWLKIREESLGMCLRTAGLIQE